MLDDAKFLRHMDEVEEIIRKRTAIIGDPDLGDMCEYYSEREKKWKKQNAGRGPCVHGAGGPII